MCCRETHRVLAAWRMIARRIVTTGKARGTTGGQEVTNGPAIDLSLAVNLLGDWPRDALNPKLC